jgi:hypothetical protein
MKFVSNPSGEAVCVFALSSVGDYQAELLQKAGEDSVHLRLSPVAFLDAILTAVSRWLGEKKVDMSPEERRSLKMELALMTKVETGSEKKADLSRYGRGWNDIVLSDRVYILTTDHSVQVEVPLADFVYAIVRKTAEEVCLPPVVKDPRWGRLSQQLFDSIPEGT